jgi:hypothetical protein
VAPTGARSRGADRSYTRGGRYGAVRAAGRLGRGRLGARIAPMRVNAFTSGLIDPRGSTSRRIASIVVPLLSAIRHMHLPALQ